MAEPDRSLEREWDELLAKARHDDATAKPGVWPPPLRAALVEAARSSPLAAFHPFTSMSGLWFSARPQQQDPLTAGIGISMDPDEYVVWWGRPFDDHHVIQLQTTDPREAVALVVLLCRL